MQWYLVLTVLSTLALSVQADDDCLPPKPGDKHVPAWECCSVPGDLLPEDAIEKVKKCAEKFLHLLKLAGPPSGDTGNSTGVKEDHTCAAECVFKEIHLLTSDNKLDKDAIKKLFSSIITGNKDMDALLAKGLEKCFTSYDADIDQSLKCKSGAKELEQCLMRDGFLNCPKTLWTASTGCEELKTKVAKCPKFPVMLFNPL